MKTTAKSTEEMARQGFGLLLELRARQDAHQCLAKALACLELLVREKAVNPAPIMLSVAVAWSLIIFSVEAGMPPSVIGNAC